MRFNEIKGFEDRMLFLTKFTKSEYVQDFLDGNLYMNNFKYFVEQEKKTKHKGQGDSYEGAFINILENSDIYINDTLVGSAESTELSIRNNYIDSIPLFSMCQLTSPDFEVIEENEQSIKIKLSLTLEEINKIKEDFQCDKVIFTMNYDEFQRRVTNAAKNLNTEVWSNPIQYIDFSWNKERHERFEQGYLDVLYNKHESLKYQREFRYILPKMPVDQNYIFKVGDLSDIFYVSDIDDFLSGVKIQVNTTDLLV